MIMKYLLTLETERYNTIKFTFEKFEELDVFIQKAFKASNDKLKANIEVVKEGEKDEI